MTLSGIETGKLGKGDAMKSLCLWTIVLGVVAMSLAYHVGAADKGEKKVDARVFELRTYHAAPGKMDALHARFRDHTCKLFKKHGMTIVGFWSPTKPDQAEKTLIYILAFPSQEAANKSWKAFRDDPEWKAVREASEKDGKLVDRVDSVFMKATDYSPMN
jgi:NIPSNAP